MVTLTTKRLVLRPLEPADAHPMYSYRSVPEVSRYQSWVPQSAAEVREFIERSDRAEFGQPGAWSSLAIMQKSRGYFMGDCGVRILDSDPRQGEIGVTLAPQFQGRGYATEAVCAMLDFLLLRLEMHRVFASVDPRNLPSITLMQRVGLRQEAHFVQSLWFKGEWADDIVFAILRTEWEARRAAAAGPPPLKD